MRKVEGRHKTWNEKIKCIKAGNGSARLAKQCDVILYQRKWMRQYMCLMQLGEKIVSDDVGMECRRDGSIVVNEVAKGLPTSFVGRRAPW